MAEALALPTENDSGRAKSAELSPPGNKRETNGYMAESGRDLNSIVRIYSNSEKKIRKLNSQIVEEKRKRDKKILDKYAHGRRLGDLMADFIVRAWDKLREKNLRTAHFGAGEVSQRLVSRPTIELMADPMTCVFEIMWRDGPDSKFIKWPHVQPEVDKSALHSDLEFAESLSTIKVVRETKLEIHPTNAHSPYWMASLGEDPQEPLNGRELEWEIGPTMEYAPINKIVTKTAVLEES